MHCRVCQTTFSTENKLEQTPYYRYNLSLLDKTLQAVKEAVAHSSNFHVHYAIKANSNPVILDRICKAGFGVDCVSGAEVEASLAAGFKADSIAFAGVGKTDREINLALDADIFCFNVESVEELQVIQDLAAKKNKTARIAFRVNPNVDAHTNAKITTGLAENKFGINMELLDGAIDMALEMSNIELLGIHFHIGSQITQMEPFRQLCAKANAINARYLERGIRFSILDMGGGLGIDYTDPIGNPIPDFKAYFDVFRSELKTAPGQQVHFELGRSIVAQCGSLITQVTFVKKGTVKEFAIVDAGFNDLIRPALYGAHHAIRNISNTTGAKRKYDVVGPICESSDVFDKDILLTETHRGDYLEILSAGAYGEVMASQYNMRSLPKSYFEE